MTFIVLNKLYHISIYISIFTFDLAKMNKLFTSPSLAAAVVMGRNANGRTEWKTNEGITIKQIEENQN